MELNSFYKDNDSFFLHLNSQLKIVAFSYGLDQRYDIGIGTDLLVFLNQIFCNDDFCNSGYIKRLTGDVQSVFKTKTNIINNMMIIDENMKSLFHYSFVESIEFVVNNTEIVSLNFSNFLKTETKVQLYKDIFENLRDHFKVFSVFENVGRFVVDNTLDKSLIYANDNFAQLLSIENSPTGFYNISHKKKSTLEKYNIKNKHILSCIKSVDTGKSETCVKEWAVGTRWVKIEVKALKRDRSGKCLIIGGIVYDVSSNHEYIDLEYLYSIYELAITTGGIGIFYFNLDNHEDSYFQCNEIYAKMIGLSKQKNGLYLLEDFKKSLRPLEEEISNNEEVDKSLQLLLTGDIGGTTDDILKIYNAETKEVKYLLSSSRIYLRYEDGSPRRFGGVVIDITDRIIKEKKQIKYAYVDELTGLANNRKLLKDIRNKNSGIGLFFDLDNFKRINDEFGHKFGDDVLRLFGETLTTVSNGYNNVVPYRLYGDEFFIFAEKKGISFSEEFQTKFKNLLVDRVKELKHDVVVEASMGVSVLDNAVDIDEFIKMADYAMYETKIKKSTHFGRRR